MESKLKTLIVDDEPLARRRLRRLLAAEEGIEIVGECGSASEARELLEAESPDLVLLDVQMPGENGLELARGFPPGVAPAVVFVTAFDQHAVRAFELHALDYLLKPIETERLHEALSRVRAQRKYADSAEFERRLQRLLSGAPVHDYLDRIMVRSPGKIGFVKVEELHWIEADGNYVRLHLDHERPLVRRKISAIEAALDPSRFLRIHRSAIVNLERVKELRRLSGGDYTVLLDTGAALTMSRGYRERFEAVMGRGLDDNA